jgi:hypothetical protein
MTSEAGNQVPKLSPGEWQIDWLLSDAPRSPSEAAARVQKIAQQSGKSIAVAALELAEDLKNLRGKN